MPINTRESYIEIGTSYSVINGEYALNNVLKIPVPIELGASDEFSADAERNANNTMILQQVGRTQYVPQFSFLTLTNKKWWEINRWFEKFGMVFYVKQLKHTTGEITIQRFYRGNVGKATPSKTTEIIDGEVVPTHYLNCSINFIDMGENDVIVVKRLNA